MTDSLIPYSFTPGTKAKAQEVNANFIALADSITGNTATLNSNKLNKDLSNITQTGINTIKNNSAPPRNIGEIITSAVPLSDAGLHLLDGALLSGSGSYSAFVTYIAGLVTDYPDLFETEANWQSAVATYGVCGKFVYDSVNNTVRLPKITGIIEGTTDATALGDLIEQYVKLPNITGQFGSDFYYGYLQANGCFSVDLSYTKTRRSGSGTNSETAGFSLNASRSSSVYSGNGTDTKIQPQAIKVLYYIVIATATKTEIQIDIDEIATDLNGKADTDLTNCTNVAKIAMAHNAMPSETSVDLTLGASGTNYQMPADGWLVFAKASNSAGQYIYLGAKATVQIWATASGQYLQSYIPVEKGQNVNVSYSAVGSTAIFKFYYANGSESEAA